MFAVRCPHCGQPGPVALATPEHFSCTACGYAGAVPDAVAHELRRAGAVVSGHDARERQFSRFQRRMALSSGFSAAVYVAAMIAALSPFACCLTYFVVAQSGPFDWGTFFLGFIPVVVVLIFGGSGYVFMRRRLGRVRELIAVVPPRTPGEAARCHLCGGDVVPTEGEAYTRCSYCQTDNLTDPRVLAGLTHRREMVLEHFEASTTERSRIARQAFRSAMRGLLLGTLAAAPASCVCTTPLLFVMWQVETEPYPTLEYSVVDAPGGECLIEVVPNPIEDAQVVLHSRWDGDDDFSIYRLRSEVPTFRYGELIGLRVQEPVAGHGDMTIEGVFGTAGTAENRVVLRADDGFERRDWPQALCLVPSATSPVSPIPLTVPPP